MIRVGLLSGLELTGTLTIEAGRLFESEERGSGISRDVFRYPKNAISVRDYYGRVDFDSTRVDVGRFEVLVMDTDAYDPLFSVMHVSVLEREGGYEDSYEMVVRHGQLKFVDGNMRIDGDGYTFCFEMTEELASRYTLYAMDEITDVSGLIRLSDCLRGREMDVSVFRENGSRDFGNGDVASFLSERVRYGEVRLSAREIEVERDVAASREMFVTLTGYRKTTNEATSGSDYTRGLLMTDELIGSVRFGKSLSGSMRVEWLMGDTFVRLDEVWGLDICN